MVELFFLRGKEGRPSQIVRNPSMEWMDAFQGCLIKATPLSPFTFPSPILSLPLISKSHDHDLILLLSQPINLENQKSVALTFLNRA